VTSVRDHFIDRMDPGDLACLADACEPALELLRVARDRD
jgi:hypothetical protein